MRSPKKRKLTEAEYQKIVSRLLAKWDRETQTHVTHAHASRRQAAHDADQWDRAARTTVRKTDRLSLGLGGGSRRNSPPEAIASRRGGARGGSRTKDISPVTPKPPGQAPARVSLVRTNPGVSLLWSPKNRRRAADVHAKEHALAWWRCPRRLHPDWQEFIDVVARGRGQCPSCPKAPPVRPRTTSRGATGRTRRQSARSPVKTPYEKAFGTDPVLRKLNPPEAIRDAWR